MAGGTAVVPTGMAAAPPALADGVEFLGVPEGSGYRQAPGLLRHGGRTLELSPLLYQVCAALAAGGGTDRVAAAVSARTGRTLTPTGVEYLLEHKLAPLGILAGAPPPRASPAPAWPVLGLSVRAAVVPRSLVRTCTGPLQVLFRPAVVAVVLAALTSLDGWLLATADLGVALRAVAAAPEVLLALAGVAVVGGAFHELGHATACRYGGAEPGAIGAGVYLIWPVFYNDLNDSYRLDRAGRLRADLGGVYFNAVMALFLGAIYLSTGFSPLLAAIAAQHLAMAQQFVPFVRLDGYYIVSDLIGVPDLFGRMRPVLSSLRPGRRAPDEVSRLTSRARVFVTVWALTTLVALVSLLLWMIASLPALVAGLQGAVLVQGRSFAAAWHDGALLGGAGAVARLLLLLVPPAGALLVLGRLVVMAADSVRRR